MIEDKSRTNRASEAAGAGESGWFPASLEALFGRIRRQKWVLLAAFIVAIATAYAGAPGLLAAAGWLLLAAAALVSPSGPPSSKKTPISQRLARPAGADDSALIAAVPDPCLLLSADGRVLDHNAAASELFGHIQAGRPVSALLRAPEIAAALGQAQSTGEAARVDYFERVPIDRWFEAHIAPIGKGKGDGRGAAYLLLLHDRTEQQRVERMRVDFIANASHELRTPLASLAGFIETLQGSARDDPEARARFLDIMRTQAERMSRLVDDLLSLSRIELSAHIRPTGEVDLAAAVAGVADSLTPLASAAGVKIEVARPDDPVPVVGDRDELAQVFQNLIDNAIKYGAEGGRVVVTVTADEGPGEVTVGVRDYGPGIAAEHLPRLTERFYRVDVASSREKGGTGLGLAIVKHILNRHGGRLQIASRLGEGATFTVRLPLKKLTICQ